MSGQRGDTGCLARSGLFIDDDNWFGNTRTPPIRLRTTTCAFRAHQRSSMSAEQQSHKTRGACSERSRSWLRTWMEAPDPGDSSSEKGDRTSKQPRVQYWYGYALWVLGVLGPAGAEVF